MIIACIILGLFSGLLGGLLGIGGGVITVPGLFYLMLSFNYPSEHLMQVAVSTSLASTCLTSLGSCTVHWRRNAIVPSIIRLLIPGLVLGCPTGAILASFIPTASLRTAFGLAAILLGPYFFFPRLPNLKIASAPNRSLSFVAFTVGTASSLLGIGGGIFTVPILIGYQVPIKNAVGTSSASTLVTAFLGSVSFLIIVSLTHVIGKFPQAHLGFIDLKAWAAVGISSLFTAPIGARLSLVLPIAHIKRIFGCALTATGIIMLFVS